MCGTKKERGLPLRFACSLLLIVCGGIAASGQNPAPSFPLSGIVLDPRNAVITDAKVVLRREGDHSEQVKLTDQKGEFRFTQIAAGNYEIEVQKEGFRVTK